MALDTTRSLTGQEVVVLCGDKDDALNTFTLGNAGNISSWIQSCTPSLALPTNPRTPVGGGANAVTREQPVGLISVSFSIQWLVNSDVVKEITKMVAENRLGRYAYPFRVIFGIAASDNTYHNGLGFFRDFSPPASAESLISGTSVFTITQSYTTGQTTGQLI